jgi:hypothetical protein
MLTTTLAATLASIALLLAPPPATPPATDAPRIPAAVFVTEKPKDAKCVSEVKKSAKKGDTVVFTATVGGRAEPFVKTRAIFMVADRCLKACNQNPEENCATPWDYCCEPPESKKANMLTVQFTGDDGKPLKVGARSAGGLEPLAQIVVEGVVAEADDKGTFIVTARKVFVEKPAKAADGGAAPARKPE